MSFLNDSNLSHLSTLNREEVGLKLVVLGRSLVGKTALTFRFINNKFPTEHDTTIEDSYSIPAKIDDFQCQFEILDTAGQDDYQSMLETWINSGSGFLLVYSIDDIESFNEIKIKLNKIIKLKEKDIFSCIIVGNKCDLDENRRKVPKNMAEEYAKSKNVAFVEASALKTINVKEAFIKVAYDLMDKKQRKKSGGLMSKMCGCKII